MTDGLDVASIAGLSEQEAAGRLKDEGYNELPSSRPRGTLATARDVVREPMFLLLVACGTLYLVLGDIQEALLLLGFVFVVVGITVYQERKTERTLEALRDLSSPRALVIRDRQQKRVPGREVVRGDVVVLSEGDRVPADAVVLSCVNFSVDESLLTGESKPVRKIAQHGVTTMGPPGGDDQPFVYSGTLVVQGRGVAITQAVGPRTEIGKIGRALQTVEPEDTALQRETGRLVRNLAILGSSLAVLVVVVYGLGRGGWLDGFLAGITLAMATLPEEFPVVLTIFLALGAWRISRKQVLTRRMPAIEALGSATVLCVDKTGTITQNRMSVAKVYANGQFADVGPGEHGLLPEAFHELVEFGVLASQREPFDPMERALRELGKRGLSGTEHMHEEWTLVEQYPLSRDLLALSHVWRSPDGRDYVIAAKGAPEAVADLCHLGQERMAELSGFVDLMAAEGLRVLAVAKARFKQATLPAEQHIFTFELVGLIGLADPVRPKVAEAIRECYRARIRVVMITGDYPATAQNIARQIGLESAEEFITGPGLDAMDDVRLQQEAKRVNIFARVVPEQKLRLVNALKASGDIVAMTGDGVNDAPALKSAHIGVAMGSRGTDVAREAAALVVLDDNFTSIVSAVRQGRRVFDNLRKAMAYIFAIHVPIAGMSLIPVVLRWPLVLLPVHIVFLELIIDPACSVVFEAEPEEADVMTRKPRDPREPLFGRRMVGLSLLQGVSVLAITLAVFGIALRRGLGEGEARALTFATLIFANLGLIFTNRSWSRTILVTLRSPNAALWWVLAGAISFLGMVLYVPFLRELFAFAVLQPADLGVAFAGGFASIMWFEGLKMLDGR